MYNMYNIHGSTLLDTLSGIPKAIEREMCTLPGPACAFMGI